MSIRDKLGTWLLRKVTKNKSAVMLTPMQFYLAQVSERNGSPLVDWENVFVRDKEGNFYVARLKGEKEALQWENE